MGQVPTWPVPWAGHGPGGDRGQGPSVPWAGYGPGGDRGPSGHLTPRGGRGREAAWGAVCNAETQFCFHCNLLDAEASLSASGQWPLAMS